MSDRLGQTPWQTVGPFFHYALPWKGGADLTATGSDLGARLDLTPEGHYQLADHPPGRLVEGQVIDIVGAVTDADGAPVVDALVEIWQADPDGVYASHEDQRWRDPKAGTGETGFPGFGRSAVGEDGVFHFRTVRPGAVPRPDGSLQAPHIAVGVFGRGLLKRLVTRLYFADDPANVEDPILALVPEARRDTLMARMQDGCWRFDIRISGDNETVFFDV